MSTTVIAFFNNKGGVGKTSLVYHLAWMYADLGLRVVAADLDPQANLTAAFLDEDRLEELWPAKDHPNTIFGCVQPLLQGTGDIAEPHLEYVSEMQPLLFADQLSEIALLVGDLLLSGFEDELSDVWPKCLGGDPRAFRIMSAFWRIMQRAADLHRANVVLMDLGPNLGAINRAALIAADYVVVPLSPDLFSLQGLRNLGPTLRDWRKKWKKRLAEWQQRRSSAPNLKLPEGHMLPIGYIVLQHAVRMDRPVQAYDRWIALIPEEYREYVLDQHAGSIIPIADDPHRLALLKHYRSLMPLAQKAHKPTFSLKPAARHSIGSLVGQAVAQRLNTLLDKVIQSLFLWMVPSFRFIIVVIVVVLFFLIVVEVRTIENFSHQYPIDRCRAEVVLLLHELVTSLFDGEQFFSNARPC